MSETQETRYIVRVVNKDLNGLYSVQRALRGIKGIGYRMAANIASAFEKQTGISAVTPLGEIPEEKDRILEEIILHPEKFGIPVWSLNRRNDFETGSNQHLTMSELDFSLRKDLQRLNEIKSYRGLRHSWGLTVRGQKTKSTHRGKGGVIGVMKKDAGKPAAAAAAAPTGKKEEKKK